MSIGSLRADLAYGLRLLRRAPGFTVLSVLIVALGIGSTTAVFSVVNSVLLRPLPYRDPARLVFLYEPLPNIPNVPLEAWGPVNGDFAQWQKQSRSFTGLALFTSNRFNVSAGEDAFRAAGSRVTGQFFSVLGVPPEIGRAVAEADTQPGNRAVVVISDALWKSRFGADRGALGKELWLDARPYRIIGVMPPGFRFPHGTENPDAPGSATDFWLAWQMTPQQRASRDDNSGNAIGRLRAGVEIRQAQAEIASITARFPPPFQQQMGKARGEVRPVDETVTGGSRRPLLIFMTAVLLVLLIACANAAGLAVARASGRQQEMAIRAALGASRFRLTRQLLSESLSLALAGGLLGTGVALLLVRLLVAAHPAHIARIEDTTVDLRVLFFSVFISLAAAVVSGFIPAWTGSRTELNEAMKRTATRSVKGRASWPQRVLMVTELALTIVLLAGAGLLIRSFLNLRSVDTGFSSRSAVSFPVELYARYDQPEKQNDLYRALLTRTQAVPGLQEAAIVDRIPLGGGEALSLLEVEGYPFDDKTSFENRSVSPRYFSTMGIPLLEGRVFNDDDASGRAPVILVSRSFERRYFPGRTAIGRRVRTSGWRTIVGVVADVRQRELDAPPPMQVYLPLWQTGAAGGSLVVRSVLPPQQLASTVRSVMRDLDPRLAVGDFRTVDELVAEARAEHRYQMLVLTGFGGIALLLSLIGLYALMSWSVDQRTAEIGVRMALGAQRRAVVGMVFRQAAIVWLPGTGLGFAGAWAASRWIRSLLFEVQPADPATFLAVAVLFCAVAAAACYLPARRATRVDPAISLRYE